MKEVSHDWLVNNHHIRGCINLSTTMKTELVKAAAEKANVSKRTVIYILDKYTGDGSSRSHMWNYEIRERGAKVYDSFY